MWKRSVGHDTNKYNRRNVYEEKIDIYIEKPKPGDVIFFKSSERICYTGIVYKVLGKTVYTIEGNNSSGSEVIPKGGAVCKKQYLLGNTRIAGYGRPTYDK